MKNLIFFHGVVLARIIRERALNSVERYMDNNSSYVINNNIGIYIKYSQKRISPWSFSFSDVHVREIKKLKVQFKKIYIVLACNDDGICCLNFKEFSTVISVESKTFPKWIRISRIKREKYSVSGSDGKLNRKVGNSDFPKKIYR